MSVLNRSYKFAIESLKNNEKFCRRKCKKEFLDERNKSLSKAAEILFLAKEQYGPKHKFRDKSSAIAYFERQVKKDEQVRKAEATVQAALKVILDQAKTLACLPWRIAKSELSFLQKLYLQERVEDVLATIPFEKFQSLTVGHSIFLLTDCPNPDLSTGYMTGPRTPAILVCVNSNLEHAAFDITGNSLEPCNVNSFSEKVVGYIAGRHHISQLCLKNKTVELRPCQITDTTFKTNFAGFEIDNLHFITQIALGLPAPGLLQSYLYKEYAYCKMTELMVCIPHFCGPSEIAPAITLKNPKDKINVSQSFVHLQVTRGRSKSEGSFSFLC